jgi:predicted negative regulator of RcsB-dependent stress response
VHAPTLPADGASRLFPPGTDFSDSINGERFAAHVLNKIGDLRHRQGRSLEALESFQTALQRAHPEVVQPCKSGES